MNDMTKTAALYGTTKAEALRAARDGLPSLLPNSNRWKGMVEAHRWGEHGDHSEPTCPECEASSPVEA